MRDQDRIDSYYRFGTMDRYSEKTAPQTTKRSTSKRGFRLLRMATLLWSLALRNFSAGGRD